MGFPDTITQIKEISNANRQTHSSYLLVEEVGYQKAVIDQLLHDSFNVTGVKVSGDKRSRLMSIATMIQTGRIKFPRHGAEALVQQIVGFGAEWHDDLVDAFTIIAHHAIQFDEQPPSTTVFVPRTSDRWEEGERNWSPAGYGSISTSFSIFSFFSRSDRISSTDIGFKCKRFYFNNSSTETSTASASFAIVASVGFVLPFSILLTKLRFRPPPSRAIRLCKYILAKMS